MYLYNYFFFFFVVFISDNRPISRFLVKQTVAVFKIFFICMCFNLITKYEINFALTLIIEQCHNYFENTYLCIYCIYIYIKEKAK